MITKATLAGASLLCLFVQASSASAAPLEHRYLLTGQITGQTVGPGVVPISEPPYSWYVEDAPYPVNESAAASVSLWSGIDYKTDPSHLYQVDESVDNGTKLVRITPILDEESFLRTYQLASFKLDKSRDWGNLHGFYWQDDGRVTIEKTLAPDGSSTLSLVSTPVYVHGGSGGITASRSPSKATRMRCSRISATCRWTS